jgi:hypothetical protein
VLGARNFRSQQQRALLSSLNYSASHRLNAPETSLGRADAALAWRVCRILSIGKPNTAAAAALMIASRYKLVVAVTYIFNFWYTKVRVFFIGVLKNQPPRKLVNRLRTLR